MYCLNSAAKPKSDPYRGIATIHIHAKLIVCFIRAEVLTFFQVGIPFEPLPSVCISVWSRGCFRVLFLLLGQRPKVQGFNASCYTPNPGSLPRYRWIFSHPKCTFVDLTSFTKHITGQIWQCKKHYITWDNHKLRFWDSKGKKTLSQPYVSRVQGNQAIHRVLQEKRSTGHDNQPHAKHGPGGSQHRNIETIWL